MKLVDMQVLGTCAVRCVGSSPTGGIKDLTRRPLRTISFRKELKTFEFLNNFRII